MDPSTSGPDVSRAYTLQVPLIVTTVLALVLTALRIYVRVFMIKMLYWDDFFNVLAMVTVLVVMGLVLGATSNGLGRHVYYLDSARAVFSVKLLRITEFMLIFSTIFLKISICLFLKRFFLTSKRWVVFLWSFIVFNTIVSLFDAVVIFPQCTPVELNWDRSVKGHCWSDTAINAIGIVQGLVAASTDICLSLLPMVFLWNLKINAKVKVGICGLMALGLASGAFAIARTVLVPRLTATRDATWDLVNLFILEATFGVIAAAAPSIRALFRRNSVPNRYASPNMPGSIPLQSTVSGTAAYVSRRCWCPPGEDEEPMAHGDENYKEQAEGTPNSGMWSAHGGNRGGIVKTTDVHVLHSSASHCTS